MTTQSGSIVPFTPSDRHRTDDPSIWGLLDVALGRPTLVVRTIYLASGDSASGIAGRLLPCGTFLPKHSSRVGWHRITLEAWGSGVDEGQCIRGGQKAGATLETVWDGAIPGAQFTRANGTVGFERTRGALLGDYDILAQRSMRETPRRYLNDREAA